MTRIPDQVYRRLPRRLPDELRYSNYCLSFNGQTQNVVVSPFAKLAPPFSLVIWARRMGPIDATFGFGGIIGWRFGSELLQGVMVDAVTNVIKYRDFEGVPDILASGIVMTLNRWYNIILTHDGVNVTIYVNGISVASVAQVLSVDASTEFDIGGIVWGLVPNRCFNGYCDEASAIAGLLTPYQVQEIWQRGYARRQTASRVNLRMEENQGLTAFDDSGLGNNGSLLPALTPPVWTRVAKYELLAEAGV